jgi:hypothetical protein
MAVYNGSLYAPASGEAGNVYRYNGGTSWTSVGALGASGITSMIDFNGSLFACSTGSSTVYKYGDGISVYSDVNVSPGSWYHLVGTYDGSIAKIYLNGRNAGSAAKSMSVSTNDYNLLIGSSRGTSLGGWSDYGEDHFGGKIDEVQVYSRALSAGEVQQLYYGGLYDGNKMGADRTSAGDQWKAGYRWNSSGGSAGWSADANSAAVTIVG